MATLDRKRISSTQGATVAVDRRARGHFYQRLSMLWTYAILIVLSLIILFPFLWLVTSSLKSEFQYFAIPIQ